MDLADETARLRPLARGIVGQSAPYALFPVIGGRRDTAVFIGVDARSAGFGSIVRRVPLRPLSGGPKPGVRSVGTERRGAAITTSGDRGFISHGGDGLISVVDPLRAAVRQTVRVPSALTGGGYVVTVQPGRDLVDVMAR